MRAALVEIVKTDEYRVTYPNDPEVVDVFKGEQAYEEATYFYDRIKPEHSGAVLSARTVTVKTYASAWEKVPS